MSNVTQALASPLLAAGAGFVLTAFATWPLVEWLRARQIGKAIREDGPDHSAKAGTPTMGGLAMLAVLIGAALWLALSSGNQPLAAVAVALVAFGILGAIDDWAGLARRGRARPIGIGLSARVMIAVQVGVALAIGWWIGGGAYVATVPDGPFWFGAQDWSARFGLATWVAVAVLVLVGTVNGVNLTDGLDGLAAGVCSAAFAGLAFAIAVRQGWTPEANWALLASGACLGFLVHNRHPARVFMGNVTSMALGGAMATLALVTGAWPLLPIIGAVLVAEVLSDIVQVGFFKMTGGRRILRCAPLHHHFEMGGWPETVVVRRFWLGAILAGIAGVGLAVLGPG